MTYFQGWRRPGAWAVTVALIALSSTAEAGPWSQLPDAADRLAVRPGDQDAERVVRLAEASLVREAQAGHLAATRTLYDTYATVIAGVADGRSRLARVEDRVAEILLLRGDELRASDLANAARSWALAAELSPASPAATRLRSILEPPREPEPGQVWSSPVDGAALVFHPPAAVRIGCTESDGACLENEIYFRWAEVPALWMEAHEVSNRRYRRCVDAGACSPPEDPTGFDDPERNDHPVVGVSWRQARAFARWAGRRLPSEAEWERAARGEVTDSRFPWGNARRHELANVWDDPRDATTGGTSPCGSFPITGYGLFDMAGNVWEWCEDRYQTRFSDDMREGGAAREGWGRVVRGGSWRRAIDMARVSTRLWFDLSYSADDLGFRCVLGHGGASSVENLILASRRAFPIRVASAHALDLAELEAEDRRYLERRVITLYVVEGRMEEALVPAALRLEHEPKDPVAADLLERFESETLAEVRAGGVTEVEHGLAAYRQAVAENQRLGGRYAAFERRLLDELRSTVRRLESRAEQADALAAAELALTIAPGDAVMTAAVGRLARRSGASRVWPGDGKGMVWVAAGRFRMGASVGDSGAYTDEMPPHEVTVEGFWLDRTEVTNDEYRSCVDAGVCTPPARTEFFDNPNLGHHPVLWVDWYQARTYASWAGKRLPSEAEWEIAARAGSELAYPWGASWEHGRANGLGTSEGDTWGGTAPVASFEPNRWGLYDLIGNAAEWIDDVYNETFFRAPSDGRAWYQETGPAGERRRVIRGAGYDDPPSRQRVSRRFGRRPENSNRSVGFRCAADDD